MKSLILILAASTLLASAVKTSPAEIVDFIDGLVDGLEQNPSEPGVCGTDIKNMNSKIGTFLDDIESFLKVFSINGLMEILKDAQTIEAEFKVFVDDCDWSSLIAQINTLFGETGIETLLGNYFKNLEQIQANMKTIQTCSSDYTSCGQSVGTIFRLMIDWSLKTQVKSISIDWTFIDGVMTGLQKGSTDSCKTDLIAIQPSIETALETAQEVANGNIFKIGTMENQVIDVTNKILNDPTASACDWAGLNSVVLGLLTPEGVTTVVDNYTSNWEKVNSLIASVKDCTDYTVCGTNVGTAIQIVLGWGTN